MATMKDVARLAGVSVATVSATISGKKYVSPALQAQVKKAVSDIKYRPNVVASNLKLGRTSLIGLIIPDINNPFYTDIVSNVQACARAAKLSVTLGISDQDPEREKELIEFISAQHAEALIICSCGYAGESSSTIRQAAEVMHLVMVDAIPDGVDADCVELDNFSAGKIATEHILAFGHRDVAVIAGPQSASSSDGRVLGYKFAMRQAGLVPAPGRLFNGGFQIEMAYSRALDLLKGNSCPSAVFVCNNLMLIGVMRAIADLNLRVPEDISVVSIDDFPWSSAFRPAITTVRQPTVEMGNAAFDLAKLRIDGFTGPPERNVFAPSLIERASCARPKISLENF